MAIDMFLQRDDAKHLMSLNGFDFMRTLSASWFEEYNANVALTRLRTIRDWYGWCADRGIESFDPDVAIALGAMNYTGSTIGKAVLRMDPDSGPLTEAEAANLNRALWAELRAIIGGTGGKGLPLRVVVACLLMSVLGPNPANLRQLEEEDLKAPARPGDPFTLLMPRAKKAGLPWRGAFKERVLSPELGMGVQALIEENRRLRPEAVAGRPLFRRQRQHARFDDTPFVQAADRVPRKFFGDALALVAERFDLRSRQGMRLAVTPRRLRYTVAKRLVARGATPIQLMDILDHSNVNNVLIYFDCGLEMVPHLDKALGPMAKALAALLDGRAPAVFVDLEPAFRSLFKASPETADSMAPMRCLTCPKFEPRDAVALRRLATNLGCEGSTPSVDSLQIRRAREAASSCERS